MAALSDKCAPTAELEDDIASSEHSGAETVPSSDERVAVAAKSSLGGLQADTPAEDCVDAALPRNTDVAMETLLPEDCESADNHADVQHLSITGSTTAAGPLGDMDLDDDHSLRSPARDQHRSSDRLETLTDHDSSQRGDPFRAGRRSVEVVEIEENDTHRPGQGELKLPPNLDGTHDDDAYEEKAPRRRGRPSKKQAENLDAMQDDAEIEVVEEKSTRRRGRPSKKQAESLDEEQDLLEILAPLKRPAGRGGKTWTADYLLRDPKSKLVKTNLIDVFKNPQAWDVLTKEQKIELTDLMGEEYKASVGTMPVDVPNVPLKSGLLNDTAFRSDVALFKDDLQQGRFMPAWQQDATIAMEQRARGDFDEWKNREIEQFWGQKQKLAYGVIAGDSAKIRFEALVEAGCFAVGDVWTFSRGFGRGKNAIKVEKEATIVEITDDSACVFTFPPGQAKFSAPAAGKDIRTEPLNSPQKLGNAILRADGRMETWPNGNAWKEFRCYRKNQDMGSLWEVREIYWAREESRKETQEPASKRRRRRRRSSSSTYGG